MRLSIIVPVYNVENYIHHCLESILAQKVPPEEYEIILVNDGSTDSSPTICTEYQKLHSHIRLISQKNKGVGAARNKGFSKSRGDYIYFVDPDDYIARDTLNRLLDLVTKESPDILTFRSLPTKSYDQLESTSDLTAGISIDIMDGDAYLSDYKYKNEIWWYFISREFLRETGLQFIEGRWMEDAIFTVELLLKANKILVTELDVHRHVKVPFSAMTNKEPSHYRKIIYDNANAAVFYDKLIGRYAKSGVSAKALNRLKIRQESFSFFLIIRAFRSEMCYDDFKALLSQLKNCNAYPMFNFISEDYNKLSYKILIMLFNKEWILLNSFRFIRKLK